VIACDIFHERITLRTAEGDSRVIALADLRVELEGLDQPIDHAHDDVPSHPADDSVDAAVHSMLDTVETEIGPLAAAMMALPPARTIERAPEPEPELAREREPEQAARDADAPLAGEDAAADATRRKRRRGRRGGRRLRAAEQRRQTEPDGSPMPPEGDDDADDGDDNEE
jgi:hypothetical protein